MYKAWIKLGTLVSKLKCNNISKQKRKTFRNALETYRPVVKGNLSKINHTIKRRRPIRNLSLKNLKWLAVVFAMELPEDERKITVELHKIMNEVLELITVRKFGEADVLLLQSKRLAEKLESKYYLRQVEYLMGILALEQKRYRVAQQKLERIVKELLDEGLKEEDTRLLQVSLQLARVYEAKELQGTAEKVYIYCMNNLKKQEGKSHSADILLVDSLWNYADFAMRRRRYADEQELREMAYKASCRTFGEIHEYTRDILGNLGRVCLIRGEIQKGKEYLEKAANTAKALVRKDTSAFIVAVGRLFLAGRMYGEARIYCSEGLQSIENKDDGEGRRLRNSALRCLEEVKKAISPKS